MFANRPAMVWQPKMSEFVLNRLVELVFNLGFKEAQMKNVATEVLVFIGIHVSTLFLPRNRWGGGPSGTS
jgi:hypothetical protein